MDVMDTKDESTLKDKLAGRVARFSDRREDWSVFGFETALDPRFARAQRRYLGASGSADPSDLRGAIPASAFTMSIQSMPVGNRIPMHCHETEEIFFILEGECLVRCWDGEESLDIRLAHWDLVCLPPFLQHEVFNVGSAECHLQTLLAKPQPLRPHYADSELLRLQAAG
jgi:mannose-6-phosphate isomerase-like protein (cupin superfamily)